MSFDILDNADEDDLTGNNKFLDQMKLDDQLMDRKLTMVSTASFDGVPSQAASSSYSEVKKTDENMDDKLLISENMSSKFESVEILQDHKL